MRADSTKIFPETVVKLKYPANCVQAEKRYFEMNLEGEVRACEIKELKNVLVNRELVVWKDGHMIPDAFPWPWVIKDLYGPIKEKVKFIIKNTLRKKEVIDHPVLWCLDSHSTGGYYHWIVEILPRLWMAKAFIGSTQFAVPDYFFEKFPFCKEFFKLLGVENFLILKSSKKYLLKELLLTTRAGSPFYPQSIPLVESVNWFKEVSLREVNNTHRYLGERIYISRSRARYRKVLNEDELLPVLKKYGFQIIYFEDYTLSEQVGICHNAKVIMGLHGAGLTNLAFMPTGSKVIELRPDKEYYSYNFFFILSQYFSCEYNYIFCDYASKPLPTEKRLQDYSVTVSVTKFEEKLQKILTQ